MTVRPVRLNPDQLRTLKEVALKKFETLEEFTKDVARAGEKMNHPNYWMYEKRVMRYFEGNKNVVHVRSARAMYESLGKDERVSFLKDIGQQKLKEEKESKRFKGSVSYEEFMSSR